MNIKKQLPQFTDTTALFIVLGTKEGVFYLAHNGAIETAGECSVETPKYSDNEGFFKMRAKRGIVASGSVREIDKAEMEKSFAKACRKRVSEIEKSAQIGEVFLFVPSRIKNLIQETLPVKTQKKIVKIKTGNHHEKHPFEILEMLRVKR